MAQIKEFLQLKIKGKGLLVLLAAILTVQTQGLSAADSYTAPEVADPAPYFDSGYLLRRPVGARISGMGAYLGHTDDVSSAIVNPANLGHIDYWQMQLSHRDEPAEVDYDSIISNIPLEFGTFAVYGTYAHVYDYKNTYYNKPANPYKGYKGGVVGLAYGMSLFRDQLYVGTGIKWVASDAPDYEQGLFMDVGLQYRYDLSLLSEVWSPFYYFPQVAASLVARNIHPRFGSSEVQEIQESTESYDVGLSFYYDRAFALNVDFVQPGQLGEDKIRLGMEIFPSYFMALRGGVSSQYFQDKSYTLHAGVGIGHLFGKKNRLSVEYGFETDIIDGKQQEKRHNLSVVSSLGGWRYTQEYADDTPIKLTKLIDDKKGFKIAERKEDKASVDIDGGGADIQAPGRKWVLTVFDYKGYADQGNAGEVLADKITNSVIKVSLQTNLVKMVPAWKQEKIAPMLKRDFGEDNRKYLHRLGTTLGTDYILIGAVRIRGEGAFLVQSQLFDVQARSFVLNTRTLGNQNDINAGVRKHLKQYRKDFAKAVQKKKSSVPVQ